QICLHDGSSGMELAKQGDVTAIHIEGLLSKNDSTTEHSSKGLALVCGPVLYHFDSCQVDVNTGTVDYLSVSLWEAPVVSF
ncbi:hypothetical protein DNTS_009672, partial [Danionella cerebrum]